MDCYERWERERTSEYTSGSNINWAWDDEKGGFGGRGDGDKWLT